MRVENHVIILLRRLLDHLMHDLPIATRLISVTRRFARRKHMEVGLQYFCTISRGSLTRKNMRQSDMPFDTQGLRPDG